MRSLGFDESQDTAALGSMLGRDQYPTASAIGAHHRSVPATDATPVGRWAALTAPGGTFAPANQASAPACEDASTFAPGPATGNVGVVCVAVGTVVAVDERLT
jgi:hypothetical protein